VSRRDTTSREWEKKEKEGPAGEKKEEEGRDGGKAPAPRLYLRLAQVLFMPSRAVVDRGREEEEEGGPEEGEGRTGRPACSEPRSFRTPLCSARPLPPPTPSEEERGEGGKGRCIEKGEEGKKEEGNGIPARGAGSLPATCPARPLALGMIGEGRSLLNNLGEEGGKGGKGADAPTLPLSLIP